MGVIFLSFIKGKKIGFMILILGILLLLPICSSIAEISDREDMINLTLVNIPSSVQAILTDESFEEEVFLEGSNGKRMQTAWVYERGKIFFNCTVYSNSSSSVYLKRETCADGVYIWDPLLPTNLTIEPGNTFSETFTLENGLDRVADIDYIANLTTLGSNATIYWQYKVVFQGRSGIPIMTILASFIVLAVLTIQFGRRRK